MVEIMLEDVVFIIPSLDPDEKMPQYVEELIEAGNEGLKEAAVKYEPNADSKFIRFAVPLIRQHILQAIESKAL